MKETPDQLFMERIKLAIEEGKNPMEVIEEGIKKVYVIEIIGKTHPHPTASTILFKEKSVHIDLENFDRSKYMRLDQLPPPPRSAISSILRFL